MKTSAQWGTYRQLLQGSTLDLTRFILAVTASVTRSELLAYSGRSPIEYASADISGSDVVPSAEVYEGGRWGAASSDLAEGADLPPARRAARRLLA